MPAITFSNALPPPSQAPASSHALHPIPASPAAPLSNVTSLEGIGSSETALRRNHDRLKTRQTTIQRENTELRDTAQQVRSDLNQIDAALEEVLNDEDLPVHSYDKLVVISGMLASLKTKAR